MGDGAFSVPFEGPAAVSRDGLVEQRARLVAIAGCIAAEQHPGVPLLDRRLSEPVPHLVHERERREKVTLGHVPVATGGGGEAHEALDGLERPDPPAVIECLA